MFIMLLQVEIIAQTSYDLLDDTGTIVMRTPSDADYIGTPMHQGNFDVCML